MQPDALNARFALDGQLTFTAGKGGFVNAVINNARAGATVALYAGQVLSWRPYTTQRDVLFLSERAFFQAGKAIKGGIPVCWPWFGPDPSGQGRPAHGFARISEWEVLRTAALDDGSTQLLLGLTPDARTHGPREGDLEVRLEITVGDTLRLALTTHNRGHAGVELTQALHTYFAVGDIAQTTVHGLDGTTCLDKVDGGRPHRQSGAVTITGEVDRIYTGVDRDLEIHDAALGRVIRIHAGGSNSTVVWNPWREIAAQMADLDDADYHRMLCVETANAGPDVIRLAGGAQHTLVAKFSVMPAPGGTDRSRQD